MAFKMGFRQDANPGTVISRLLVVVFTLWIGGEVLDAVITSLELDQCKMYDNNSSCILNGTILEHNSANTFFYNAYEFAGMTGTNRGTGILSVVGLIGVAWVVLSFVKVGMK